MSDYYEEEQFVYSKIKSSTKEEFIGNGWSVKKENEKYYFEYISGQLQGKENKIEISKIDFQKAKKGHVTFDEMCRIYNVY